MPLNECWILLAPRQARQADYYLIRPQQKPLKWGDPAVQRLNAGTLPRVMVYTGVNLPESKGMIHERLMERLTRYSPLPIQPSTLKHEITGGDRKCHLEGWSEVARVFTDTVKYLEITNLEAISGTPATRVRPAPPATHRVIIQMDRESVIRDWLNAPWAEGPPIAFTEEAISYDRDLKALKQWAIPIQVKTRDNNWICADHAVIAPWEIKRPIEAFAQSQVRRSTAIETPNDYAHRSLVYGIGLEAVLYQELCGLTCDDRAHWLSLRIEHIRQILTNRLSEHLTPVALEPTRWHGEWIGEGEPDLNTIIRCINGIPATVTFCGKTPITPALSITQRQDADRFVRQSRQSLWVSSYH